ncbi:HupE/UreJ family protein [bacterium]|nr:MAG: HupE/UreJ family protein [bacterium]
MQRLNGVVLVMLFLALSVTAAWSHTLNMTGVKVRFDSKGIAVSVVAHAHLLQTSDAKTEISNRLKLHINGQSFSPTQVQLIRDKANGIIIWQAQSKAKVSTAPQVALDSPIFPEVADQRTVLTVIKDRQVLDEVLLNSAHPSAVIGGSNQQLTKAQVALRFVVEGIGHIFGGIDHILFLLSLLLLGGNWRQLLKIVTAFTLAHSITLSLAATGTFSLPPRFVEPVIALSIVFVALSNFLNRHREQDPQRIDWRPYMAFGFGLIHGFGFAGALAEVGLPREALAWALVAFNCGVEIGQAVLVLLFSTVLGALVKQWPSLQQPVVRYGSMGVAAMGAFWFIQRIFTV